MPEEPLIKFRVPEVGEIKAYLVKTKDGRLLVRTEDELQEIKEQEAPRGGRQGSRSKPRE